VETTRRGVAGGIVGRTLTGAVVRQARLRWPVPPDLAELVAGRELVDVRRRAKYLLFDLGAGHLIVHLGMSGSLRLVAADAEPDKHDHVDLLFKDGRMMRALRFRDPRRFGAVLWQPGEAFVHPLLANLGPEPLGDDFTAAYLHQALHGRSAAIKLMLMDGHVVVGVGNIYANEALFRAGIRPSREAGRVTLPDCQRIVTAIRETLAEAIAAGGSTLRDFVDTAGQPGYFQQRYFVYGRQEQPCLRCGTLVRQTRQGQRSTFWCPLCQPR
ncbi:MAG: bifunctional DNA-formamidopyrimidine glycosylase/DNA-(apurinic or apyrimidinic site) lyase, partial [Burkholderiales bacterium]|nr:bifunctional DNA-formamidopyrimidine glycosylase/DNA-(apurinic or apyrimidinic site) lyase [Burkholderiales bacterium]